MTCAKNVVLVLRAQEAVEGIVRLDIYLFGAFIFGFNFWVNLAVMVRERSKFRFRRK